MSHVSLMRTEEYSCELKQIADLVRPLNVFSLASVCVRGPMVFTDAVKHDSTAGASIVTGCLFHHSPGFYTEDDRSV